MTCGLVDVSKELVVIVGDDSDVTTVWAGPPFTEYELICWLFEEYVDELLLSEYPYGNGFSASHSAELHKPGYSVLIPAVHLDAAVPLV